VTFAGRVAGMRSVTIRVNDELRVSLSYLSSVAVSVGDRVPAGRIVGRSGLAHGEPAVHMSTRIDGTYVDPMGYLRCRSGTIRLLGDR
ncbi:MAG: peptidoglycan DD-metalloendopeptidase family protein, partial [Acidimicrobiia bacterium]|nr:peptidoglycan DD-metalloendopeptidase family protein [Acidimicrobiia bacterium]